MANLVQNSSGIYSIRFRFGTFRFNRSLELTDEKQAKEEKARIEKTMRLVKEGEKDLPEKASRLFGRWFFCLMLLATTLLS
jgi:hypothetical protein